MKTIAVLWDYDGTLMNSRFKNFAVNRELFCLLRPKEAEEGFPQVLTSVEYYQQAVCRTLDWMKFYMQHVGFTQEEALTANKLWSEYQMKNDTPLYFFEGIPNVLEKLESIPQGICSLNDTTNILATLKRDGLEAYFKSIIGFDKIELEKQKPHPAAFFRCLEEMKIEDQDGAIYYIGDHKEDVSFARNAGEELKKRGKKLEVKAITASYSGSDPSNWDIKPDFVADSVGEIADFIKHD